MRLMTSSCELGADGQTKAESGAGEQSPGSAAARKTGCGHVPIKQRHSDRRSLTKVYAGLHTRRRQHGLQVTDRVRITAEAEVRLRVPRRHRPPPWKRRMAWTGGSGPPRLRACAGSLWQERPSPTCSCGGEEIPSERRSGDIHEAPQGFFADRKPEPGVQVCPFASTHILPRAVDLRSSDIRKLYFLRSSGMLGSSNPQRSIRFPRNLQRPKESPAMRKVGLKRRTTVPGGSVVRRERTRPWW